MSGEERMARAQDYVLGLMDDGERRRAERDLEVDAEFRDCVMALAERLRIANRDKGAPFSDDGWADISERLGSLPQMAGNGAAQAGSGPRSKTISGSARPVGRGAHATGGRKPAMLGVGLAIAFAAGYFAGRLALF